MLKLLLDCQVSGAKIVIYTDSMSNLQALESARSYFEDDEDLQIRRLLKRVAENNEECVLQFVKAHDGLWGNET